MSSRILNVRLFIVLACMSLLAMLALYPKPSFEAALRGVAIWWDVLFPALFPFFVLTELLLGFGIVHFIGRLLDPLMRPLFKVPGEGGFVLAMGFASGYPIGARLASQLWEARLITREEGERLVAFTSTSDPIFLIGAVCVGFFHHAGLAIILAVAHYGGGLFVGLCYRYHGAAAPGASPIVLSSRSDNLVSMALAAMHKARLADRRSLGQLLEDAVKSGFKLIFMIGGLVVFASVLLEIMGQTGILATLNHMVASSLSALSLHPSLSNAVVSGAFEVTLGAKAAAIENSAPLVHKVATAAFVLSWSGLSVHAQIVSLLTGTNIRYTPFLVARLLHGLLSATLVWLLWRPLMPAVTTINVRSMPSDKWLSLTHLYGLAGVIMLGSMVLMIAFSMLVSRIRSR